MDDVEKHISESAQERFKSTLLENAQKAGYINDPKGFADSVEKNAWMLMSPSDVATALMERDEEASQEKLWEAKRLHLLRQAMNRTMLVSEGEVNTATLMHFRVDENGEWYVSPGGGEAKSSVTTTQQHELIVDLYALHGITERPKPSVFHLGNSGENTSKEELTTETNFDGVALTEIHEFDESGNIYWYIFRVNPAREYPTS